MKRLFTPGIRLIKEHLPAYVILNATFYGLMVAGAVYAFVHPEAQQQLTQSILLSFNSGPLSVARDAYLSGNVAYAAAITFAVNTVMGSILSLTVPSLVIPFAGSLLGLLRALMLGIALAPSSPELARAMVPHSLVILLEGQGYVLVMFGVHVLWASAFGGARRGGLNGFASGYLAGLRHNLSIYVFVLLFLAVAAIYEAFELIYLVR